MNLSKLSSSSNNRLLNIFVICFFLLSATFSAVVESKSKHHTTSHHKTKSVNHKTVKAKHKSKPKHSPGLVSYIKNKYKRKDKSATEIARAITIASNRFAIDKFVLAAIIAKESSFKPRSRNGGNHGLMQVHSSVHAKEIRKEHATGKITKPIHNIMVGSHILSDCLKAEARGNIKHALSLYNKGCSAGNRTKKIKAGKSYANWVLAEANVARHW